ncbi:MAG: rod shape-determining protein MreD [Calditrichia bacterium]
MNKISIRYILFFLVALLLQITVVKYIQIFNWRPDLVLIVLVYFSLRKGPNWGMTAGFLSGLVQDLLSTHYIGLSALSKTIAGFVAGSLQGKFAERAEFFLTLLISGLVHDFVYFMIYTMGENFSLQSSIFLYTIPNMMYTLLLGGFLYYLIEAWATE